MISSILISLFFHHRYLLSLALGFIGKHFFGNDVEFCSQLIVLRCLNLVLGLFCLQTLFWLLKELHPTANPTLLTLRAFVLCISPVFYFFNFLYYTDVGSVLFVLLMYYKSLRDEHKQSAFVSFKFEHTYIYHLNINIHHSLMISKILSFSKFPRSNSKKIDV
jgi:hypothetical protein